MLRARYWARRGAIGVGFICASLLCSVGGCVGDDPAIGSVDAGAGDDGSDGSNAAEDATAAAFTIEPPNVVIRPGGEATLTLHGGGAVDLVIEAEALPDGGTPAAGALTVDSARIDLTSGTATVKVSASSDAQQQKFRVAGTAAGVKRTVDGQVAGKPGTLDAFWMQQGFFDFDAVGECSANAVVALTDGKFIVAGTTPQLGAERHLFLARFSADGRLDTTFGEATAGWVKFGTTSESPRSPTMALLANGTIAVAAPSPNPQDFKVWAFTPEGAPIQAWGGKDGKTLPLEGGGFLDNAIGAYQNTIVVAGTDGTSSPGTIRVRRYLLDAMPDPAFGSGTGLYEFPAGGMQTSPAIEALAVEANGTVWLTGSFYSTAGAYTVGMWRVDAAGTTPQVSTAGPEGSGYGTGLALQDGRAVVGVFSTGNTSSSVWRFTSSRDTTFGTAGIASLGSGSTGFARSMAADSNQRVLVLTGGYAASAINVHRLLPDGAKDVAFGDQGLFTMPGRGYGFAISGDKLIVVGGNIPTDERKARIARVWL